MGLFYRNLGSNLIRRDMMPNFAIFLYTHVDHLSVLMFKRNEIYPFSPCTDIHAKKIIHLISRNIG
jgi:hypothetical protein